MKYVFDLMCIVLNFGMKLGRNFKFCPDFPFSLLLRERLLRLSLALVLVFASFSNAIKAQSHQGELYLDEFCQTSTCVVEVSPIRDYLVQLRDQCQTTVNILLFDRNIDLAVEEGQILSPDGEIWMHALVDYLLLIEPGSFTLYAQQNGQLLVLEDGPQFEALEAGFSGLLPYPNKNYCAIQGFLSSLACGAISLSTAPCQVDAVTAAADLTFLHLDVEELEQVQETKRRLIANHCARVVIIKLPRFSPYYKSFVENHELPPPLVQQMHSRYGREVTLFLAIPDPQSMEYALGIQHIQAGDPANGECASQVRHILEWLPSLENLRIPAAMAELEALLKGGEQYQNSQLADLKLVFTPDATIRYGFDSLQYSALSPNYERLNPDQNPPYYIPWQSIKLGDTDAVLARRRGGGFIPSSVQFVDDSGIEIPILSSSSNQLQLAIPAPLVSESTAPVYAQMPGGDGPLTVGQLNRVAYEEKLLHVVIVPVNGAYSNYSAIQLQNSLKAIWKQSVVDVSVTMHSGITVPDFNGILKDQASGFLSNYTPQMRDIIGAYKAVQPPQPNVYYLFLVNDHEISTKLGYMPRKKAYGFIVKSHHTGLENFARTLGHELGHGAYVLAHIYNTYPALGEGNTDNLLDKGQGKHLDKYQWDLVHDPANVWSVLDADEDRESDGLIARSFIYSENIYYRYEGIREEYTCLTPSGELFAIPKAAIAAFYPRSGVWPAGCMVGFNLEGVTYYGWWKESDSNQPFLGYAPKQIINNVDVPGNYYPGRATNQDYVFAASISLTDTCVVEIRKGSFTAANYYIGDNTPINHQLNIDPLPVIETTGHLTSGCLGGLEAWCAELYSSHPYLSPEDNSPIARVVKGNPCLIADLIHYDFSPDNIDSEWMEGLKNISAMGVGFGFLPVIVEVTLSHIIREFGRQKINEAIIGYSTDLLLQACIKYYFPPNETEISWSEAFSDLDQFSATASAVEAMIDLNNPWLNIAISSASSCLIDGFTENGEIRDEFSMQACAIGMGSAVLVGGVLNSFPHIKSKLQTIPKPKLVKGIINLLGDFDPTLHLNGMIVLPDGARYAIYKFLKAATPLDANDIEALFDISGDQAQSIAQSINADLALEDGLLKSDLWIYLRKQTASTDIRADLIGDLAEDVNLVRKFKERPELVKAWEVARNTSFSTDVSWLSRIDGWLAAGVEQVKVTKLLNEIDQLTPLRNSLTGDPVTTTTLKQGLESGEIDIRAWVKINDGIPALQGNTVKYYHYLRRMSEYVDEVDNGGVVKYYRVQTEHPGSQILTVNPDGSMTFNNTSVALNLSTDTRIHADYYAAEKLEQGYTPQIIEFEVPKSLDVDIKTYAIPQDGSTSNIFNEDGLLPKIVDPNQPGDPFELTSLYHSLISLEYVVGSAKILP